MVKEYIEREAAIAERKRSCDRNCAECDFAIVGDSWCEGEVFVVDLLRIPAADVRPVVPGKWTMNSDFPDRLICSECGAQFDVWHWEAKQMHFCPNCGARMEES